MSGQIDRHLDALVNSLRLLAARFKDQMAMFPEFVHVPDELALVFDDCIQLLPQIVEAGLISTDAEQSVRRIVKMLAERSAKGNAEFWTLDALERGKAWDEIRSLAVGALELLGFANVAPTMDRITYIPGPREQPRNADPDGRPDGGFRSRGDDVGG